MEVEIQNPTTQDEATHIANLYDTITFSNKVVQQPTYATHETSIIPTSGHAQPIPSITPMDLSVVSTPRTTRRLPRLTPAEYDQLKAQGSCF